MHGWRKDVLVRTSAVEVGGALETKKERLELKLISNITVSTIGESSHKSAEV